MDVVALKTMNMHIPKLQFYCNFLLHRKIKSQIINGRLRNVRTNSLLFEVFNNTDPILTYILLFFHWRKFTLYNVSAKVIQENQCYRFFEWYILSLNFNLNIPKNTFTYINPELYEAKFNAFNLLIFSNVIQCHGKILFSRCL